MGRFYQTDKPTFVDNNILQLPFQEMASTLQKVEGDIAGGEALADSYIAKMLEAKALQPEQEKLNTILTGYEDRIEEMTSLIQENPLEFRRKLGDIRKIGRDLNEDFTRGDIARIQKNVLLDREFQKQKERIGAKENSITAEQFNTAYSNFKESFKNKAERYYQLGEGEAPVFNYEELNAFVDVPSLAEELAKDYEASLISGVDKDGNPTYTGATYYRDGNLLVNRSGGVVTPEEIASGVLTGMSNNQELMAYRDQMARLSDNPEEYIKNFNQNLLEEATRVGNKYKKSTIKYDLKESPEAIEARQKRVQKAKYDLDNPEVKFNFTSGTTKQVYSKDTFNPTGIKDSIPILEAQLEQLKNTNTSNEIDENKRLRDIAETEAKLFNTRKFNEEAENYVIDNSLEKGNISGSESDFIKSYLLKDKDSVERIVKEGIEKYNLDNKYFNVYLMPLSGSNTLGVQGSNIRAIEEFNQSISNADPEFIQALDKYRKAKDILARVNGEENVIRNPYEFKEIYVDEEAQKEWYKKNAEANTLYEEGIAISPEDKEMMTLVDAYVGANSGDFKIYDTNELATDPATGKPTEREDITVNGNILTPKNLGGKNMSDVFTLVNVVPGVNNSKMVYKYDQAKIEALEKEGIKLDIDGLEDGELFTFESTNSQLNGYIADRYSKDENPEVALMAELFSPEGSSDVAAYNFVNSIIQDVTKDTFTQGPGKYFTLEGSQYRLSKNNANTYMLTTLDDGKKHFFQGDDSKEGIKHAMLEAYKLAKIR